MKIVKRMIEYRGVFGWYRRGKKFAASTIDQDNYMARDKRGKGWYRAEYHRGKKRPDGEGWLRFEPDGNRSSPTAVTLRSGRRLSVCRTAMRDLFGTSAMGWTRLVRLS